VPRGFTIEEGELTAKLSLRRKVIEQHFAAEIETLYRRG
jgi:long-subunit acyl-CoA synthetase (AMP-forming)